MPLAPSNKPGDLYLGGLFDLDAGRLEDTPFYYASKDLVTHGVCVGMTGSGKTGLCISLLEECALSGIPAFIIDPKGDLGNLLLTFPDLRPEDFQPWIHPDEAAAKGMEPAAYAAKQAETWRTGLAQWGIGPERIKELRDAVEFTLFTPGSTTGTPINVLSSFDPPENIASLDDESLREQVAGTVSSLLGLAGEPSVSPQEPAHILLSRIVEERWREDKPTSLETLIALIQKPPFDQVGALSVETFLPRARREKLALALNALAASPSFETWRKGPALDPASLLKSASGKTRANIFYLGHLDDAQRMFFVSLLLNKCVGWMRAQPGATSLKSLLYFDEIFGYLPPHPADPASKRPLLTILKQGRAFGLGTMLVTQNPVDIDYKALSNCGTWMIGKLQTDQDKARVLDGLMGAAGTGADRPTMDRILGRLGNRVFLLHNVHADKPAVIQSRWAMSYLAGPLSRDQIRAVAAGQKTESAPAASAQGTATASLADFVGSDTAEASLDVPPSPPAGLSVRFEQSATALKPALFARADLFFKEGQGSKKSVALVISDPSAAADQGWGAAETVDSLEAYSAQPPAGAKFCPLPPQLQDVAFLKKLGQGLAAHIAQNCKLDLWQNDSLGLRSEPDETREAFDKRVADAAADLQVKAEEKLKAAAEKANNAVLLRMAKEKDELARDQAKADTRKREEAASLLSNVGGALFSMLAGRKSTGVRKIGSTISSAMGKHGMTERSQLEVKESEDAINLMQSQLDDVAKKLEADIAALSQKAAEQAAATKPTSLFPLKTNITIHEFGVLWQAR